MTQGRQDAAASGIRRAVGTMTEPLQRTRMLPAYVEIMLATGDLDEARRASKELDQIAARIDSDVIGALAGARARRGGAGRGRTGDGPGTAAARV